jgi:hypothetical protein
MPMFGDKSISGYILGFIFRIIRIVVGLIVYVVLIVLSVATYLAWAAFPILVIAWGLSA